MINNNDGMRFLVLIHSVSLILIVVLLLLIALLVHVQGIAYKAKDVEAPGLVHPVHVLLLVAVLVVLVVVIVAPSVSWLGL